MDSTGGGHSDSQGMSGATNEGQVTGNLTDDERARLGAQQAALIQMQKMQDDELEEKAIRQQVLLDDERRQRNLMDAQKEALAMQQQAMLQQEQIHMEEQRHMQEQQQLQLLQAQAINENQQMQQMALLEQQKEEQDKHLQQQRFLQEQQQQQSGTIAGPPPAGFLPPVANTQPGVPAAPGVLAPPGLVPPSGLAPPPGVPQAGITQQMTIQAPTLIDRGQHAGGLPLSQGGPPMMQGGPPPMSQGGPSMAPGGPPMLQGAPPMMQGAPPMMQGAPPMPQGGPPMPQGGPPMPQGGPPMAQGGPPMAQGGPPISQGGQPMPQGGPPMPQGGPPMPQGGPPMVQGGPPMVQGGPPMPPGGLQMPQGGRPMPQGGPSMPQGGPPLSQGSPIVQGGPPISQGGPPMMSQGGPPMSQGGPPMMSQAGPPMAPGGPQMSQGGPQIAPAGPPMSQGGPPMLQGGPPMLQEMQIQQQQQQPPPPMAQMRPVHQMPQPPPQHTQMGQPPAMPPQMPQRPPTMPPAPPGQRPTQESSQHPPAQADDNADESDRESSKSGDKNSMKLPMALERVLAFKETRAQQVGVEDTDQVDMDNTDDAKMEVRQAKLEKRTQMDDEEIGDDDAEDYVEADEVKSAKDKKESKNKKRKKKKKKRAKARTMQTQEPVEDPPEDENKPDIEIEYVPERLNMSIMDPLYSEFNRIFQTFKLDETTIVKESRFDVRSDADKAEEKSAKTEQNEDDDDSDDSDVETKPVEEEKPKLSKKKMKKLTRLSVAELKQLVSRPDVVEMHDITAQDPKLLVHLKATRNTVPVPRHWCFKRKYLQGKRGIEKPPFDLPDYIKATGIMEMREALAEKEDQKNLKAKMRERVRPKLGKIDIDYQKLHDAFFKWQTKPKLTMHGELYYEGKEFETRLKEKKPGNLSEDLRTALGMPIGPNCDRYPPPWLIAMQRYGPPPSYPNLKIPGLNAPIPEGCSFGYHAGGWGKPPVDETGKPLYGDVFGTQSAEFETPVDEEEVDVQLWGDLESSSESGEESEEESDEAEEADTAGGLVTPAETGLVTPSGLTSVPIGVETPDMIELRKKRIEDAMDQGGDTPALYQVLPEKKTAVGGAMMGSAHVYDMSGMAAKRSDAVATEGIEVALNPEELDLDTAAMQAKYEQTVLEQQSQLEKEDLSDMVAEHAAKQKKRKKQLQDSGRGAKKYKDFKF